MTAQERMMKVGSLWMRGYNYRQIGMEMGFSDYRARQLVYKFRRDSMEIARQDYFHLQYQDREMFLQLSRMQDWVEFLAKDKE